MTGGMEQVNRPFQRKILPERNVGKTEPEQAKKNIHK
jgi:hypothetical protein